MNATEAETNAKIFYIFPHKYIIIYIPTLIIINQKSEKVKTFL